MGKTTAGGKKTRRHKVHVVKTNKTRWFVWPKSRIIKVRVRLSGESVGTTPLIAQKPPARTKQSLPATKKQSEKAANSFAVKTERKKTLLNNENKSSKTGISWPASKLFKVRVRSANNATSEELIARKPEIEGAKKKKKRKKKKINMAATFSENEDDDTKKSPKKVVVSRSKAQYPLEVIQEEEFRNLGVDELYKRIFKQLEPSELERSQCLICGRVCNASRTSFVKHMRIKHAESFAKSSYVSSKPASRKPASPKSINRAIAEWLQTSKLDAHTIDNEPFRQFIAQLNPKYIVPSSDELSRYTASSQVEIGSHMTAFCCRDGKATLETDIPVPVAKAGEALIRVSRAGVCGTDYEIAQGYKPGFSGILGHEFVGVVVRCGSRSDENSWLTKRVVGEINLPCEECDVCNIGDRHPDIRRNHCPNRKCLGIVNHDGAFAEYITLPIANLYVVPLSIPDSHAVFAEPLAAACRIVEQNVIQKSDRVAILGDGRLGLLIADVLGEQALDHRITLIGKHTFKLSHATTAVNITTAYTGEGFQNAFDVCIECTGSSSGINTAVEITRPEGTIVMKSTCANTKSTAIYPINSITRKRLTIRGSRCGPFLPALKLLESGTIDVSRFITAEYSLRRIRSAFVSRSQRTIKAQIIIQNTFE